MYPAVQGHCHRKILEGEAEAALRCLVVGSLNLYIKDGVIIWIQLHRISLRLFVNAHHRTGPPDGMTGTDAITIFKTCCKSVVAWNLLGFLLIVLVRNNNICVNLALSGVSIIKVIAFEST